MNSKNQTIGAIVEQIPKYPQTKSSQQTEKIEKFKIIVSDSPRKISLVLCTENFVLYKKINLNNFIPTKIYYTPNGQYLVALTFPPDDTWHEKPCIQIIDPSKETDSPISSYKIELPQNLDASLRLDDYLLVTNDHIVYVSSNNIAKENCTCKSRYFEIFRSLQQYPFIEKIETFQDSETFYQALAKKLNNNLGTSPLYLSPEDGFSLLYFEDLNCIGKYILSKKMYTKASIKLDIFNYDMVPIAFFPNKYLAFCKDNTDLNLYDFDLALLDTLKIDETMDGSVENLRFSGDGTKLIVTTNKKVLVFAIA